MLASLRKAYSAGYRAGRVTPAAVIISGQAGDELGRRRLKHLVFPLNPYHNTFAPRTRPLLALVWEMAYCDGRMKRLAKKGH